MFFASVDLACYKNMCIFNFFTYFFEQKLACYFLLIPLSDFGVLVLLVSWEECFLSHCFLQASEVVAIFFTCFLCFTGEAFWAWSLTEIVNIFNFLQWSFKKNYMLVCSPHVTFRTSYCIDQLLIHMIIGWSHS